MTSDFSLPFCQLKLQILFNAAAGDEVKNGVLDVMFKTAVADARLNRTNWIGLIALMNQDAVRQVRYPGLKDTSRWLTDFYRFGNMLRRSYYRSQCWKT